MALYEYGAAKPLPAKVMAEIAEFTNQGLVHCICGCGRELIRSGSRLAGFHRGKMPASRGRVVRSAICLCGCFKSQHKPPLVCAGCGWCETFEQ